MKSKWTSKQHDRFSELNDILQVQFEGMYNPKKISRYCVWIIDNDDVFRKFKDFAMDIHRRGFRKYSADCILNYLRWHEVFTTSGDPFKINNDFSSMMARHLVYHYPNLHDLFSFRQTGPQRKDKK